MPAPSPRSVTPAVGWAGERTAIVIRGEGFVARTELPASGGAAEVDTGHRAWLGDAELEDVVRVDAVTLHATVPAGLPAGPHPLVVENAFGTRGRLEDAFEVVATPGARLSATLEPAVLVSVGQQFTVRARIANGGSAPALGVTAALTASSGAGAEATVSGPTPASVASLVPGTSVDFTWSCVAIAAGQLSLAVAVTADDGRSGAAVETSAAAGVTIQLPAGLAATVAASRATANPGQAITVTFTVTNGGAAAAELGAVIASLVPAAGASCSAPAPATPLVLGSGESVAFGWTCTATEAGRFTLSGQVEGTDANSGEPLSATPASPAEVTVQTPATLGASIALPSGTTTASVGQPLELVLTVANAGGADAEVTAVTPIVTPTGAAACGTPAPALPQIVAGGGSVAFRWTCTPAVQGTVTFGATVAGVDRNTGAPLAAAPGDGPTVAAQLPAALTAVASAQPAVVSVGQPVAAVLTVANGGGAAAIVGSVAPSATGSATASCTQATPAPPQTIGPGQAVAFTWACTPSAAGTLALSGTATGSDANSGAPLVATPGSAASVTVQAPAVLAIVAFAVDATSAVIGRPVGLTLTIRNSGTAPANVSAVTPHLSPAATGACQAAAPPAPLTIAGGASLTFTWTCTASAAGDYVLSASLEAADANSGAPLSLSTPGLTVAFHAPAGLAAIVTADRAVATVGQAVAVTFTLTTDGNAVTVTQIAPSVAGASAGCGPVAPALPQHLASGGAIAFTWSCTPSAAGTLSLSGTASATDDVSGEVRSATPATPASVTVQRPPALAATAFTATRTTASLGQAIGLSLTLANGGEATARISAFVPTVDPAASAACTSPSPPTPVSLPGGGSATFTWSCTGTLAGSAALGASVSAVDVNTGSAVPAAVIPIPVVFQAPAALSATSFSATPASPTVGVPFAVTLVLSNTGGAAANVTALSFSATPAPSIVCTAPTPAPPQAIPGGQNLAFSSSCTATTARSYTLRANATAADANSGAALTVSIPPLPVTVGP